MRVLGLDVGERRIGVALSDPSGVLALPLEVIQRKDPDTDLQAILELVKKYQVERIVIGIPVSLDGSLKTQAQKVYDFYRLLEKASPVPLEAWDERFSTVEAQRRLREAGVRKSQGNKGKQDMMAATLILQGYLEWYRTFGGGSGPDATS